MATYAELNAIVTDSVSGAQLLRDKVEVAAFIAASIIIGGTDTSGPWNQTAGKHDKRLLWVDRLLANPVGVSRELFHIVIASNSSATQSQILNATDATIQSSVNASIDALATNLI